MMRKITRIVILAMIVSLCFVGCGGAAEETQQPSAPVADAVPEALLGSWSSADSGQLDLTETFTFADDGTFTASAVFRGSQTQSIGGSFTVSGHTLSCTVSEGVAAPYDVTFEFRIDGRELFLTDDGGTAQFLRVS